MKEAKRLASQMAFMYSDYDAEDDHAAMESHFNKVEQEILVKVKMLRQAEADRVQREQRAKAERVQRERQAEAEKAENKKSLLAAEAKTKQLEIELNLRCTVAS